MRVSVLETTLLTDELVAKVDGFGVAFDGFGESVLPLIQDAPGKTKKVPLEWKKNKSVSRLRPKVEAF